MTVTAPPPKAPIARSSRRGPLVAVLLLAGLAIVLAGVFPFRQLIAQQRLVSNTQAKLDALVTQNRQLDEQIANIDTPVELERIAREQYGLVRPGETAYIVDPGEVDRSSPVAVDEAVPDNRSPLRKLWDFLTGRDLIPDG